MHGSGTRSRRSLAPLIGLPCLIWSASMPQLFSPIKIARSRLPNRIVLAPVSSGCATADGFITDPLADYYLQRAQGGVGLLIIEPALVLPPDSELRRAHIGL